MIRLLFLPLIGEYLMAVSMLNLHYLWTSQILPLLMDGRRRPYCVKNIRNHTGVSTQRPMEGKPGEVNESLSPGWRCQKFDWVLTTFEESCYSWRSWFWDYSNHLRRSERSRGYFGLSISIRQEVCHFHDQMFGWKITLRLQIFRTMYNVNCYRR